MTRRKESEIRDIEKKIETFGPFDIIGISYHILSEFSV